MSIEVGDRDLRTPAECYVERARVELNPTYVLTSPFIAVRIADYADYADFKGFFKRRFLAP